MVPSISLYFFYLQSIGATSSSCSYSWPRCSYSCRTRLHSYRCSRYRQPHAREDPTRGSPPAVYSKPQIISFSCLRILAALRRREKHPRRLLPHCFSSTSQRTFLFNLFTYFFRSLSPTLTQPVRLSGRSQNSRGATSSARSYTWPRCSQPRRTRPQTYRSPRNRQPHAREDPCLC